MSISIRALVIVTISWFFFMPPNSALAEMIVCESNKTITPPPFAEIDADTIERYMPTRKKFNLAEFKSIPGYESKTYVETVTGHLTPNQDIDWHYLPNGKMMGKAKWAVDNYMGFFTLRNNYQCRVDKQITDTATPTPSANVAENQSNQSGSSGTTNQQIAAVVPKPAETSSSAVTVSSNNESVSVSSSSSYTKWRGAQSVEQAQQFANEIQASIVMFMAISEVIEKQPLSMKDRVLSVVGAEITRLQAEKLQLQEKIPTGEEL